MSKNTPDIDRIRGVDSKPRETVLAAMQAYKDTVDEIMKAPNPEDEGMTRLQIKVVDAMHTAMGARDTGDLDLPDTGHLYETWSNYASPQMQEWFSKYVSRVRGNELAGRLLLSGEIEDVDPSVRFSTFTEILMRNQQGKAENSREELSQADEYFLGHPELYIYLWGNVWDKDYRKAWNNDYKHPALRNSGLEKFRKEWGVMIEFFEQDPNLLERFFQTARTPDNKTKQETMVRSLLGAAGIFKKAFPEHPNNKLIAGHLKRLAKQLGTGGYSQELGILEDALPGALYLNVYLEAQAGLSKPGETKESFLADQKRFPGNVVYVSQADWPVGQTQEQKTQIKPTLKLEAGVPINVKPWGEVQVVSEDATAGILDWLQTKAAKLDLSEDALVELIDRYNNNIGSTRGQVFLPDLLPRYHPLYPLRSLGVLAIDTREYDEMWILLDTKRADIEMPGPRLTLLKGTLAKNNDLEIDGAPEDFTYTPLHLLLNAAALWGRTNTILNTLSKEDQSYINGMLQTWKSIAKELGISQLAHTPNPAGRNTDSISVRLPVGKNTTYLTFQ